MDQLLSLNENGIFKDIYILNQANCCELLSLARFDQIHFLEIALVFLHLFHYGKPRSELAPVEGDFLLLVPCRINVHVFEFSSRLKILCTTLNPSVRTRRKHSRNTYNQYIQQNRVRLGFYV